MISPEFHVRRAIQQLRQEEQQQQKQIESIQPVDPGPSMDTLDGQDITNDTLSTRLNRTLSQLSTGIGLGGIVGFAIGSIYAFKTRNPNPVGCGLGTAVSIGLLGGQFTALRFVIPDGISRQYHKYYGSESPSINGDFLFLESIYQLFGPAAYSFASDMSAKEWDCLGSGLAGGLAGFFTIRSRAMENAISRQLSTGNVNSRGLRGALFWSAMFGLGHWSLYFLDDYKRRYFARRALRQLYIEEDQQKLSQIFHSPEIPERKQIIGLSWRQILSNPLLLVDEYNLDMTLLPFVHSEEEVEYRQYLQSKYRLLEEEIKDLRLKEKKRLKQFEKEKN